MKSTLIPRSVRESRFSWLSALAVAALAASLALVLGARAASPGTKVYVVTFSNEFGTVNLSTGVFNQIGPDTPESLCCLTWANGTLYGMSTGANNFGDLVSINPSTGQVTDIGPTGLGSNAFALGAANGHLYMTDLNVGGGTQNLYAVDPTTGVTKQLGSTDIPADVDPPFSLLPNGWLVLCDETITGVNGKLYVTYDEVSFDINPRDSTYLNEAAIIPAAVYEVDPSDLSYHTKGKPTDWNVDAVAQSGGSTYAFSVGIKVWNKFGPRTVTQMLTMDLSTGDFTSVENDGSDVYVSAGQGVFGAAPVQP